MMALTLFCTKGQQNCSVSNMHTGTLAVPQVPKLVPKLSILALVCALLVALASNGCTFDPNKRKLKLLDKADAYAAAGKCAEASIVYANALQIDPRFAQAHYGIAKCALKNANWSLAYRELSKAVDLQPSNLPAQLDMAQLLLTAGKAKEAKDRALAILKQDPTQSTGEMILAQAENALGSYDDALREAQTALNLAPKSTAPYINIALLEIKKDQAAAEAHLRSALAIDPKSVSALMILASLHQFQQRWDVAEKELRAAIEIAPKSPVPRRALAGLYLTQHQEGSAERVFIDAKQQAPDDPAMYRMLADYYLAQGRNTEALAEFAALCAQHQKDLEIRKTYVQLLLSNGRIEEAATLNAEILKKSPFDSQALIASGQIEVEQKKFDSGAKILERALKSAPEDGRGHYYLGVAYEQKGSVAQAEKQWREAVRLRPDLIAAWRSLASTATRRADWSGLGLIAEQMKAHFPKDPESYTFHATARMNQGDATTAELDLKQLISIFPQSAIGYLELAQLRVYQKRCTEAEALFRDGLRHQPSSVEALRGLLNLYLTTNQSGKALDLVRGALDRDPQNAQLYILQAEAQLKANQPSNAELSLSRSLEIDNHSIDAWMLLAQLQASLHRTDDAIASYGKAIELSPNNASLHVFVGGLYETQENWQQAQKSYRKALDLQPDHPVAANNLAYLLLEHGGDPQAALALAQTAWHASPDKSSIADTLGWAYYRVGAYSAAAPLFQEALKKSDKNLVYHYHLGLTYQQLKDLSRARAEFDKIIKLDPDSSVANDARRAITSGS